MSALFTGRPDALIEKDGQYAYGLLDDDRAQVVIESTWDGGETVAIECLCEEAAEDLLNTLERVTIDVFITILRADAS
jgi:hypothetical protein